MKRIDLIEVSHNIKITDKCPYIEPNVTEDCIFYVDGEPIGFYLTKMPEKMCKLADLANAEFMSDNVTKQGRANQHTSKMVKGVLTKVKHNQSSQTKSSAIIGRVPPQPQFGRNYSKMSSIHDEKSAQVFIKAMILLLKEGEQLIKKVLPSQYERQKDIYSNEGIKLSNMYTSSISNNNISAPFHIDTKNEPNTVNIIICKKHNSKGGDLHIPDYNATIGQVDNSILVYPAWRNVHGVTPIIPTHEGGYRNSLVFYPLKAFKNLD
jgi:hypothetical protein